MKTDTFIFNDPGERRSPSAQSATRARSPDVNPSDLDEEDAQEMEERAIAAKNLERFLADPENRAKRWQQTQKDTRRPTPKQATSTPHPTAPTAAIDPPDTYSINQTDIQVEFGKVQFEEQRTQSLEPAPITAPQNIPNPSIENQIEQVSILQGQNREPWLPTIIRSIVFVVLLGMVWIPTLGYVSIAKPTYTSSWRLILPGDGLQSALKLEDVGQATASSKSVFASRNFDPRATYREIASSEVVKIAAANSLAIEPAEYDGPKIKTVPETAILEFKIKRGSPAIAQSHAIAFLKSFDARVNQLRTAEVSSRQKVAHENLDELRNQLEDKHAARLELQKSGGVLSTDQFDRMVAAAESLREELTRETAALKELQGEFRALAESLDITPRVASWALTLKGDRLFQNIAEAYAKAETEVSSLKGTLGPRHPTLVTATVRRDDFRHDLYDRSRAVIGSIPDELMLILDLTSNPERSKLFAKLLETRAALAGKHAQVKNLNETLRKSDSKAAWLVEDVGKLSALTQETKVAEAVFTRALADVDLSQSNPFASYPLYQLLDAPSLPSKPSSPWKKEAIAGAAAATFLIILAFVALWFRCRILRARSKKTA